jgi:hypothetical protein
LNKFDNPLLTSVWSQGWLQAQALGLEGNWAQCWDGFLAELRKAHVRLRDEDDEIAWAYNKTGGFYTAKLGYTTLQTPKVQEICWWWKKLWKVKAPPKCTLFLWLVLNKKVLTWDRLQKRNKAGPSICILCRSNEETSLHLFLECPYSRQVWKEVEHQTSLQHLWDKVTWKIAFKSTLLEEN